MAAQIIRLMAERDMRSLFVANASQSAEGAEEAQKRLEIEMSGPEDNSEPLKATLDKEGLSDLKSMQAMML